MWYISSQVVSSENHFFASATRYEHHLNYIVKKVYQIRTLL